MREHLIVQCDGTTRGTDPPALLTARSASRDRIIGRQISNWSADYGLYRGQNAGFFGLELIFTHEWPTDHLVFTVLFSADWLLLDDRWVHSTPNFYSLQRPLYSRFGVDELWWDGVGPRLVGGTIEFADFRSQACRFGVRHSRGFRILEVPEDKRRLPPFGGTGRVREWSTAEEMLDAWVICDGQLTSE